MENFKTRNAVLEEIINNSSYALQQREIILMASEEIESVKYEKKLISFENENLRKSAERLKNKIRMLTSLIGYGVVSNVENNDLHQIEWFK